MSAEGKALSGAGRMLVCFAVKEEAAAFQKMAAEKPSVAVLITGMGRKNAERTVADYLAASEAACVLTCGFAGGLAPGLGIGDIFFETADGALAERLTAAGARAGRIYCADRIATTAVEKKKLRMDSGADAVEMESAAVQEICRDRRIRCATVRVISDTAEEDLPLDFNRLAKADQSLDYAKLAWEVAKAPGIISGLLRLQRQTRLAAEKLAAVLERVIG
jgi:nucleoside phosphorylase